jgi:hypothetical protein
LFVGGFILRGLLEKLGHGFLGDNIKKVKKKFSSIFLTLNIKSGNGWF